MLRSSERLTRKEFDQYFKVGKRFHSEHVTIVHVPYQSLHCAVVVSKKHVKQAVRRNTIRRRVYGQLYRSLKKNAVTGVFIVIIKPSFIVLPRKQANVEIANCIATLLKKT